MRDLFSLFLLAFVMVATSCNSSKATAQTEAPQSRASKQQGPRQGGPDLSAMIQQLDLTDEQAVSFKEVKETYGAKFRELRQSAGGDRQAMRTKMEGLRADENKAINAILNADQQQAYAKIMKEQEANRPQRGGRPGGQGRPGGGRPGGGGR
jgi:Spy/CpxP family protein refolding chaperone